MSVDSWQEAIQNKKLRIEWKCEHPENMDMDALMTVLYAAARQRRPAPSTSQDECFLFSSLLKENNTYQILIVYTYDYDFHAMYDQAESELLAVTYFLDTQKVTISLWTKYI